MTGATLERRSRPDELLEGPEWEVVERVPIHASAEDAWELITRPGYVKECHPFCLRNPVRQWPGVGSQDDIEYYSGLLLRRDFTAWLEGEGYDLWIGPPDRLTHQVVWRVTPVTASSCELRIQITPFLPPAESKASFLSSYREKAKPGLEDYLRAVVQGVRFRLETGKAVTRNQFGSHPLFSPEI